jgi:hypothetical protein
MRSWRKRELEGEQEAGRAGDKTTCLIQCKHSKHKSKNHEETYRQKRPLGHEFTEGKMKNYETHPLFGYDVNISPKGSCAGSLVPGGMVLRWQSL